MRNSLSLFPCILCFSVLSSVSSLSASQGDAGSLRIAVADVSEIMKNYKKVFDIQHALDRQFEPRRKALKEEQQKIVEAGKRIKRLRERSDKKSLMMFDEAQKFERMVFLFEKHRTEIDEDFVDRMRKEMRDVLNEIRAAINSLSERRGLHLVMRSADRDNLKALEDLQNTDQKKPDDSEFSLDTKVQKLLAPRSTVDIVGRFKRNPVLYGSDPIDITKDVLKSLNEDYEKTKGK